MSWGFFPWTMVLSFNDSVFVFLFCFVLKFKLHIPPEVKLILSNDDNSSFPFLAKYSDSFTKLLLN